MEQENNMLDELLALLSEAPDSQIDKEITNKIKKLIG